MSAASRYAATAEALVDRVRDVAKEHPDAVAGLKGPFGLFRLGLKCDDLDPSLAQAATALKIVQRELREGGSK